MASYKGSYLILTAGNTTEPVKLALARRGWVETDEKAAKLSGANSWSVNFLWKPSWNGLRPAPSTMQWSRGHALAGKRSVVNHWKAIEPLTTKDSFFQTMRQYYSAVGKNYADRLPETYVVSGFEKPSQDLWVGWSELSAAMDHHASQGRNLWLAKPTDENRGLGIELMFSKGEVAAFLLKMGRNASMGIKTHWCFQKYLEDPLLTEGAEEGRKFDLRVWALVLDTGEVLLHAPGYVRTCSTNFSVEATDRYVHLSNYCQQIQAKDFGSHEEGNTCRWETLETWLEKALALGRRTGWSEKNPEVFGASCGTEAMWGRGDHGIWGQIQCCVKEAMDALRLKGGFQERGASFEENGFSRRPPEGIVVSPPPQLTKVRQLGGEEVVVAAGESVQHLPGDTTTTPKLEPQPQQPGLVGSRQRFELLGLDFIITKDLRVSFIEVNTNPSLDRQNPWQSALVDTMVDRLVEIVLNATWWEGNARSPPPPPSPFAEQDWCKDVAVSEGAEKFRPRHGWHYIYNVYSSPSVALSSTGGARTGGGGSRPALSEKTSTPPRKSSSSGAAILTSPSPEKRGWRGPYGPLPPALVTLLSTPPSTPQRPIVHSTTNIVSAAPSEKKGARNTPTALPSRSVSSVQKASSHPAAVFRDTPPPTDCGIRVIPHPEMILQGKSALNSRGVAVEGSSSR